MKPRSLFVWKVKVRSGLMDTSVGMGIPGSRWAVRALNSLEKLFRFRSFRSFQFPGAHSAGKKEGAM